MGRCGCVYVPPGGRPIEFLRTVKTLVGGGVLRCHECRGPIHQGARYECVDAIFPSGARRYLTCADCLSMREAFFCSGYPPGRIWEALGGHVAEMDGQIASACLLALTPGARAKVLDEIDDYWAAAYGKEES